MRKRKVYVSFRTTTGDSGEMIILAQTLQAAKELAEDILFAHHKRIRTISAIWNDDRA